MNFALMLCEAWSLQLNWGYPVPLPQVQATPDRSTLRFS